MIKKYLNVEKLSTTDLLKIVALIFLAGAVYANNISEHKQFTETDAKHKETIDKLVESTEALKENMIQLNTILQVKVYSPLTKTNRIN